MLWLFYSVTILQKKWIFHGSLHCLYSFQMGKILEDLLGVHICSVCLACISITFEPTRAH